MREILYRGLRTDGKGWVEGFYWFIKDTHFIRLIKNLHTMDCEVHPEQVGQFTGFLDKNGKRIFDGDILSKKWIVSVYYSGNGCVMVRFGKNPNINKPILLSKYLSRRKKAGCIEDCEIIGNIQDNPEIEKP